ncbi:peptidase S8/S53 domain-containing protein [Amylocystis lapponica]|nr:peptidase S8/S53 domain-containing protein [Amylocystis lapponica]
MPLPTPRVVALTLCLFVVGVLSLSPRVVHESRRSLPHSWAPVRRAEPRMVLPLRVGLKQSNLASIEEYVMDVSHPDSPNYGKHWTPSKVAATFRPSSEAISTVHAWLVESGVDAKRVRLSAGGGWLNANVTIEEAERLLGTEYYVYRFGSEGGDEHVACEDKYHLPEHVSKHVDMVTPTLHFDRPAKARRHTQEREAPSKASSIGQPGSGTVNPKTMGKLTTILNELENCDSQLTLDCLRVLYNFDYFPLATSKNSLGIVEYTPNAYLAGDLDLFFGNFSTSQIGERPKLISVDGGFDQTEYQGFDYNGESNLDLQYSMGLVGPGQTVTLYQVGDLVEGASFNNFIDALDASYCTYEGGDDPNEDAVYPDPYGDGGYNGTQDCGITTPTHIISTSYGYAEADLTPAYMERQCNEYAKLGLMGVTVLYSSGDDGVAGNGACLASDGSQGYYPEATGFSPGFPPTCPYVTAVGATQIVSGASVTQPESACQDIIYSGGGFSNVFPIPDYQKGAVEEYLTRYPPPYPAGTYNTSGSRAFPDLSANGAWYVVAVDGEYESVFGTSCSSPVVGSILYAINDARLAIGKGPIGFINPTIYSPYFWGAFNDITNGTNPGCGTVGFSATPGWDPVTGVGTPDFPKLLGLWLSLP